MMKPKLLLCSLVLSLCLWSTHWSGLYHQQNKTYFLCKTISVGSFLCHIYTNNHTFISCNLGQKNLTGGTCIQRVFFWKKSLQNQQISCKTWTQPAIGIEETAGFPPKKTTKHQVKRCQCEIQTFSNVNISCVFQQTFIPGLAEVLRVNPG